MNSSIGSPYLKSGKFNCGSYPSNVPPPPLQEAQIQLYPCSQTRLNVQRICA